MFKKMLSLVAVVGSAALLCLPVGCGKNNSPLTPTSSSTQPVATATAVPTVLTANLRVLLAGPDDTAPWIEKDMNSAVTAMGYTGVTLNYTVQNDTAYTASDMTTANYDVVMVWTKSNNFTSNSVGQNLDSFIAAGGGVVMFNFAFYNGTPIPGFDYTTNSPWSVGPLGTYNGDLGTFDNTNPIMTSVSNFSTQPNYLTGNIVLEAGATQVAAYGDGNGCVATRVVGSSRVVGLNFFPGIIDNNDDGMKMMLNSTLWAAHKL